HSAQKVVVSVEALGWLPSRALDLGLFEFGCNRADHARRHLVLKLEDVFNDAVKMVGPEMAASRGIDELAADAQAVPRLAAAAFQHVADTELSAHLPYIERLALVGETRIAGDDEQPLEAR